MGINKSWKDKENASERLEDLKHMLFESLQPYFKFSGKLDLSKTDPATDNGDTLARIINAMLVLSEHAEDLYFGADSVSALQVTVENNERMKFWGRIFWLSVPTGYQSYKPGYDPFYGEFKLCEDEVQIIKIKFGDHKQTNLDKAWWFDLELDWKYEFEE